MRISNSPFQLQPPNPESFNFRPIQDAEAEDVNAELEQIQQQSRGMIPMAAMSGMAGHVQLHHRHDQLQREEQRRQQQIRKDTATTTSFGLVQNSVSSFPLHQQSFPQQGGQPGQQQQSLLPNLNRPSSASLPQNNPPNPAFSPSCFSLHDFHMHGGNEGELLFNTSGTPETDHTELTTPVDPQMELSMLRNPHSVGFHPHQQHHHAAHPSHPSSSRYSFAHQMTSFDHSSQMSDAGQQGQSEQAPRPLSLPNYGGVGSGGGQGSMMGCGLPQQAPNTVDGHHIPHQSQTCWSSHGGGDPSLF